MNTVAIAYGFIWAAIFGYLLFMGKKLGKVDAELDDLSRRIKDLKP
jgi:CcmD family protein